MGVPRAPSQRLIRQRIKYLVSKDKPFDDKSEAFIAKKVKQIVLSPTCTRSLYQDMKKAV